MRVSTLLLAGIVLALFLVTVDSKKKAGKKPKKSVVGHKVLEAMLNRGRERKKSNCKTSRAKNGFSVLNGISDERYRWRNGIYLRLDPAFTPTEAELINDSLYELNKHLCVGVYILPKDKQPSGDYVQIVRGVKDSGCWSLIGKQGGGQELNLEPDGCMYKFTIIHESYHALGFDHEQCRSDRDKYIKIFWDNIIEKEQHNFNISIGYDTYGIEYDYSSIMHYNSKAFSKDADRLNTMLKIDDTEIPWNTELTQNDILKLKTMYKC